MKEKVKLAVKAYIVDNREFSITLCNCYEKVEKLEDSLKFRRHGKLVVWIFSEKKKITQYIFHEMEVLLIFPYMMLTRDSIGTKKK